MFRIQEKYMYNQYLFNKIIEPNVSINAVHDELMLYKQVFDTMTQHIRDHSQNITKFEKEIYVKIEFFSKTKIF